MKRVVIPISDGKLSEFFGQCSYFEMFDIDDGKIIDSRTIIPKTKNIKELPKWAASEKITDIITYKVNQQIIDMFWIHKINLFVGIAIHKPNDLIKDFLSGKLKSNKEIISEILLQKKFNHKTV